MCDVWAWPEGVGDETQVIARVSDMQANRMVAGGHLRWADNRYDGLVVAGPPNSEIRHEALVMLGALIG